MTPPPTGILEAETREEIDIKLITAVWDIQIKRLGHVDIQSHGFPISKTIEYAVADRAPSISREEQHKLTPNILGKRIYSV